MTGANSSRSATSGSVVGGKMPSAMQRSNLRQRAAAHVGDEREALVLLAHPRHVAIEEHQREVLRLVLAELVETPRDGAHVVERIVARRVGELALANLAEAFFGEREEDLVLRREVAVDRRRAVFDLGGDVADGDLGVPVGDEELERGIEDGAPRALTRVLLTFFSAHLSCCLAGLKDRPTVN